VVRGSDTNNETSEKYIITKFQYGRVFFRDLIVKNPAHRAGL